jgi:subtilisin family serine protease
MRLRLLLCSGLATLTALMVVPVSAGAAGRREPPRSDGYIVVYKDSVRDPDPKTDRQERSRGFRAKHRYRSSVKGFSAKLSEAQLQELRKDPDVAFVSPDRPVRALGSVPVTTGDSVPTGVRRLEAGSPTSAHESSGAKVAVIDTGVDLDHPDLSAVNGTNCVNPGTSADDDNGHGTHVAGTIAARNTGLGVVGVAPGTTVYAVKVLDAGGGGTWSQIICGIEWATANGINVANMSLGGVGDPVLPCTSTKDPLHKAICASTAAGVNYVVAAGNDGWDFDYASAPDVPAAYPEVLTVTAASDTDGRPGATGPAPSCRTTERDDRFASFSNYALTAAGQAHTVAGPGVCIRSSWPGGGYNTISGTSMAAPHLAGAVALCLNEAGAPGPCAGLSRADVVQKVRTGAEAHAKAEACDGFTGDPQHPTGSAYYGYLAWVGVAGTETSGTARCQPVGYDLMGTVFNGAGHISRLHENDSSRIEVNAVYAGTAYRAELNPYAVISSDQRITLKRLTVDYDGHVSNRSAAVALRVLNLKTGWQNVDGPRTKVTGDRAFTWSTVTPGDYVAADGRITFSVVGTAASSFRARTDLVRFTIEH